MNVALLLACTATSSRLPSEADSGAAVPGDSAGDVDSTGPGESAPFDSATDSAAVDTSRPDHDPSDEECAFAAAVEPLDCELYSPGPVDPSSFTRVQQAIWDTNFFRLMLQAGDEACPGESGYDSYEDQHWVGDCVSSTGVAFGGGATYAYDADSNWGTYTFDDFTADGDGFRMAMDGTWMIYWTSEGSFSQVDVLSELVGSPDEDYRDGSRYLRGWVNYNNANDTSDLYVVDGAEDYCFRASASYLYCSEEPRGWQQLVGQTSAVIAFDGRSPCDGCGCYAEEGAEPTLGCP